MDVESEAAQPAKIARTPNSNSDNKSAISATEASHSGAEANPSRERGSSEETPTSEKIGEYVEPLPLPAWRDPNSICRL